MNLSSNSKKKITSRKKWIAHYKKELRLITIVTSLLSFILIIKLDLVFYFSPLIIIALFYTFSITRILKIIFPKYSYFQKKNYILFQKTIRDIPFLKIFIIIFCWTYLTFFFPLIYYNIGFSFDVIIHSFIRGFFLFAITIPFDIRDVKFDKTLTIPSFFGIKQSKYISYFFLFLCEVLSLLLFIYKSIDFSTFLALYITFEISLLFIFFIKKNSKELYFSFYIEGLSILMFILVYIADLF